MQYCEWKDRENWKILAYIKKWTFHTERYEHCKPVYVISTIIIIIIIIITSEMLIFIRNLIQNHFKIILKITDLIGQRTYTAWKETKFQDIWNITNLMENILGKT